MTTQLVFGIMSGQTQVEPIGAGDIIVKESGRRFVVESVDDNIYGPVYICVALDNGASCVVMPAEIDYRSR